MIERARKRLSKRAKKGFRGWPAATVALYGPDDSTATKITVGIVPAEDAEATDLRRWLVGSSACFTAPQGPPGYDRNNFSNSTTFTVSACTTPPVNDAAPFLPRSGRDAEGN